MSASRFSALLVAALLAACGRTTSEAPKASNAQAPPPASDAELASPEGAQWDFGPGEEGAGEGSAQTASFYGQPDEERAAQQRLPQARDTLWRTLATTRISEDVERGMFSARHSPEVRALAGRTLTISGFIMPLEAEPRFRHFLLTRYTPVCDFCPPGAPNEVVEVWSAQPLAPTYAPMRVTGRFTLTNDGEKGLFFRLDGANVQAAPSARRR